MTMGALGSLLNQHPSFAVAGPVDQARVKELLENLHAADPVMTDDGIALDLLGCVERARQ
jgi:hypothetical protein